MKKVCLLFLIVLFTSKFSYCSSCIHLINIPHEYNHSLKLKYTPQLYGAKTDDNVDDADAIQKAIDSISSKGGGILFFPKGVYLIKSFSICYDIGNGAIDLKSNVKLEGEKGAIIKVADNVNTKTNKWQGVFISRYVEKSTNVSFENLIFDLNGDNNHYPFYNDFTNNSCCAAIRTCYPKNISVINCIIKNCPGLNCLALGYADSAVISGCQFLNSADALLGNKIHDHSCILVAGNDVVIKGNKAANFLHSNVGTGIEVNSIGAKIIDNYVTGFKVGCLLSPVGITSLRNIEVSNNTFQENQIAFQIWDGNENTEVSNIRFTNNLITCSNQRFSTNFAIDLLTNVKREIKNVLIERNQIKQIIKNVSNHYYGGIIIGEFANGIVIKNNTFFNLSGSAISLINGSRNISILHNNIHDCCRTTNSEGNRIILINSGPKNISRNIKIESNKIYVEEKTELRGIWLINNFSNLIIRDNVFTGFETWNEIDGALIKTVENSLICK